MGADVTTLHLAALCVLLMMCDVTGARSVGRKQAAEPWLEDFVDKYDVMQSDGGGGVAADLCPATTKKHIQKKGLNTGLCKAVPCDPSSREPPCPRTHVCCSNGCVYTCTPVPLPPPSKSFMPVMYYDDKSNTSVNKCVIGGVRYQEGRILHYHKHKCICKFGKIYCKIK